MTLVCAACGRFGFDRSDATVDADPRVLLAFEAEHGEIVAPFEVVADAAASGRAFVRDGNSMGLFGDGSATYSFSLAEPHSGVVLWVRSMTFDTSVDSFFVAIDGATRVGFDTSACIYDASWHWLWFGPQALCPTVLPPMLLDLGAGPHTIVFTSREGQSVVDRLLLTEDPTFTPS